MKALRSISHALSPVALTVLRVVTGAILFAHGWLKATDWPAWLGTIEQLDVPAAALFAALAMVAELAGGIALVLGLLTPLAALAVLINMVVAIGLVHWEHGLLTAQGGYEFPLTLAAIALFFLVRGAGPVSLDRGIFGRRVARERREPIGTPAHA